MAATAVVTGPMIGTPPSAVGRVELLDPGRGRAGPPGRPGVASRGGSPRRARASRPRGPPRRSRGTRIRRPRARRRGRPELARGDPATDRPSRHADPLVPARLATWRGSLAGRGPAALLAREVQSGTGAVRRSASHRPLHSHTMSEKSSFMSREPAPIARHSYAMRHSLAYGDVGERASRASRACRPSPWTRRRSRSRRSGSPWSGGETSRSTGPSCRPERSRGS